VTGYSFSIASNCDDYPTPKHKLHSQPACIRHRTASRECRSQVFRNHNTGALLFTNVTMLTEPPVGDFHLWISSKLHAKSPLHCNHTFCDTEVYNSISTFEATFCKDANSKFTFSNFLQTVRFN